MANYFLYTFFSLASAFGLLAIKEKKKTTSKSKIEKEYGLSSTLIVGDSIIGPIIRSI